MQVPWFFATTPIPRLALPQAHRRGESSWRRLMRRIATWNDRAPRP